MTVLKRLWLRLSVDAKVKTFAAFVILVILLSAFFSLFTMHYSMDGYSEILEDNRRCQNFMKSMEDESTAFENYISGRSETDRKVLDDAILNTRVAMEALPDDIHTLGEERYAKTWNIKNSYANYVVLRDHLLDPATTRQELAGNITKLYHMQKYLEQYSRRLLQLSVENGSARYLKKLPTFKIFPFILMNFTLIMLLCIFRFSRMMTEAIVVPVKQLSVEARRIADADFHGEDVVIENRDEIDDLVRTFNAMKHATEDSINTMKENHRMTELLQKEQMENMEMEKRLNANRLELLKSQINPHFLFNTLNMIGSMATLEEADTTETMTRCLASLFRYNLSTKEQIVPLAQELKVAEDYMYLQKMRFGSRVSYEVERPEDISALRIPSFTMQPLVENAIVHGINKKEQGGHVRVTIRCTEDDRLLLDIADDGVGMPQSQLEKLQGDLSARELGRVGIGLGNIYLRIQAIYQGNGSLTVQSEEGKGTTIHIDLPRT